MPDQTVKLSRHEFLAALHKLLTPRVYLEVGVQYGRSLALATGAKQAIGIDPYPQLRPTGNQTIHAMTSDDFFGYTVDPDLTVDFAFIDGSHLFEDALRDFINIEQHSHAGTVVVFDDMLPYNDAVGGRQMVPGHWAGDVWKIHPILQWARGHSLAFVLVDTEPTGTMVVWGLDRQNHDLALAYSTVLDSYVDITEVPQDVVDRTQAVTPDRALDTLTQWRLMSDANH